MLITVDSVIRTYIHERNLVLHDYFRLLTIALSGLKDLAKDIEINTNVKAKEVDVDEINSVVLPTDLVEIVKIGIPNGDKILPIPKNDNINPVIDRDSSGEPVRRPNSMLPYDTVSFLDIGYYFSSQVNDKAEYQGRAFGDIPSQPWGYKRIGDRVQIDVKVKPKCVYLVYTTTGVSNSDINLIHPYAEETLKIWLDWKFEKRGVYETQRDRSAYYTSKRNLNGAINGFSYEDYIKSIRDHQVMTVKI